MVGELKLFYQAPACEAVTLHTESSVLTDSLQQTITLHLALGFEDPHYKLIDGWDLGSLE